MTAHENVFTGSKIGGCKTVEEITAALSAIIPSHLTKEDVVFVCIGTDRVTGDALGPLVGMYLEGLGYSVVGTIDSPTHALNLADRLAELPAGKAVIAVDATLGKAREVGGISVIRGCLKPGAGVGKELPTVGDYSITGCVHMTYDDPQLDLRMLYTVRLSDVMRMARDITSAIVNVLPLDGIKRVEPVKRKRGRPRKNPVTAEVTVI